MKRRTFAALLLSIFGGCTVGVSWLGKKIVVDAMDQGAVVESIRRRFRYLRLNEDDIRSFVDHYTSHFGPITGKDLTDVRVRFLMSTDFFEQGADETREIYYQGFYDPESGSENPFARFVSDSQP